MRLFITIIQSLFTFLLGLQGSLVQNSLSEVGYTLQHVPMFLLWGSCQAIYAFYYIYQIEKQITFRSFSRNGIWIASAMLFVVSLVIPYNLEVYPLLSELHVITALLGPVLTMFGLLVLFHDERTIAPKYYHWYLILIVISIGLWLYYGFITSLLEVVVTISLNFFLYFYYKNTKRRKIM